MLGRELRRIPVRDPKTSAARASPSRRLGPCVCSSVVPHNGRIVFSVGRTGVPPVHPGEKRAGRPYHPEWNRALFLRHYTGSTMGAAYRLRDDRDAGGNWSRHTPARAAGARWAEGKACSRVRRRHATRGRQTPWRRRACPSAANTARRAVAEAQSSAIRGCSIKVERCAPRPREHAAYPVFRGTGLLTGLERARRPRAPRLRGMDGGWHAFAAGVSMRRPFARGRFAFAARARRAR